MSHSEPQPLQPTRQQLDELEALMQRMLALPVQVAEGESRGAAEPVTEPAGETAVPPVPQAAEATPPMSSPLFTPLEPSRAAPLVSPERSAFASLPQAPTELGEAPPALAERPRLLRRRTPTEWWARPLLWSNRAFDHCTLPLGDPGRWLRSRRGRTWMGYSGLVFLVTAVAWSVLDWMGWL